MIDEHYRGELNKCRHHFLLVRSCQFNILFPRCPYIIYLQLTTADFPLVLRLKYHLLLNERVSLGRLMVSRHQRAEERF